MTHLILRNQAVPMARVRGWSRSRNLPRHQNLRVAIGRLIEHKILNLTAIIAIEHFIEQVIAEPRTLDGFQKLLGNNHILVDIDHIQRRGHGIELGKFFHDFLLGRYFRRLRNREYRQNGRSRLRLRPWPAIRDACVRRAPVGPQNCGLKLTRNAHPVPACRRSSPDTSSIPVRATQNRRL